MVGEAIVSLLSGVTANVSPVSIPQGVSLPWVTYTIIDDVPLTTKDSYGDMDIFRVQIDTYHTTYTLAHTVAKQIRIALESVSGIYASEVIHGISFEDQRDLTEFEPEGTYRVSQDYFVWLKDSMFSVTDIDGNIYQTVTINSQRWIVGNLRVTKYSDNTDILNLTDNTAWAADVTGAYCWYDNLIANKGTYGALYNYYALTNVKGLAYFKRGATQEAGWRLASDTDYTNLVTFLGGASVGGAKLKETGVTHWNSPNAYATDDYNFAAVPGGYRTTGGTFTLQTYSSYLWSGAAFRLMIWDAATITKTAAAASYGFSVRCVKDI